MLGQRPKSAKQIAHKEPTWLNACMGMQWSRKQIYIEIISRHALKGNLAEPSPTLWSTFFSQVHCQIFSTLSSTPMTQHFPGCFYISSSCQNSSGQTFTIKTPNGHIRLQFYGRIFSRAFLHAKKTTKKNGFNFSFKYWKSSLQTIQ